MIQYKHTKERKWPDMYGAILGDIVGSPFEFDRGKKSKNFEMFSKGAAFTDDTVMTIAVAEALLNAGIDASVDDIRTHVIQSMRNWGKQYPYAGYGARFYGWLISRTPLPYGSQRSPTAQWTATASGCCILGKEGDGPYLRSALIGRVVDLGITDVTNMGAAMAPAAIDTLETLFHETHTTPADYDLIVTGDLGAVGHDIVVDLMGKDGFDMTKNYTDCGLLLYDRDKQDMHAGGSGAGCSASTLCGYLLTEMKKGKWDKIIFAPTGALLSPTSSFQGESIPGICHAVVFSQL